MSILIAGGGTGQEVVHFYLQMCLLGMRNRAGLISKVVVIDQDDFAPSLLVLRDVCNEARTVGETRVPSVALVPAFDLDAASSTLAKLITGNSTDGLNTNAPIFSYFPKQRSNVEVLDQDLRKGFYFKPAVTAIVDRLTPSRVDAEFSSADTRTVVVGSLLGGTFAGLLVPLLDRLASETKTAVAVLFEQWFLQDDSSSASKRQELQQLQLSNTAGVLEALKQRKNNVDRWLLLNGAIRREREFGTRPTDFSGPDDPRFEACLLIDEMLGDHIPGGAPTFEAARRLVGPQGVQDEWQRWRQNIQTTKAVLRGIASEPWFTCAARDPRATTVWGKQLPAFIESGWRVVHERCADRAAFRDAFAFSDDIASSIAEAANAIYGLLPPLSPLPGLTRLDVRQRFTAIQPLTEVPSVAPTDYASLCKGLAARFASEIMETRR